MTDREQKASNVAELQKLFPNSFAIYGTALGSLREGDVIEYDPDTDIGMLDEHFNWQFVNDAVLAGFSVRHVFGMRHHGMEIYLAKNGVKTDLWLFYKSKTDPNKRFNCLWDNGNRNGMSDMITHEYDSKLFEIVSGRLGAHSIRTLGLPYVKHVYGDNWLVPIKKWNWRTDHKCKKIG